MTKITTSATPKSYFPLLFFFFSMLSSAQPFAIGHQSATFNDPIRDRDIPVEIYYPADAAGDNVSVTQTPGQFPVIAFGHGFVMGYDAYLYFKDLIVPQGFILVFPKTEGGFLPSHLEFGKDLSFCLQRLKALGLEETSIFNGRIANTNAVMGHSMGGGAAFLAAGLDNQITAIAVLAPAETNPSAIAAAGTLSIPALIVAGGNDCVTPPNTNQVPMYNALTSECKTYISITGGSHCQMADNNFACSFGEATCNPDAEISRETQHAIIGNYVVKWLQSQLQSDCSAGTAFDSEIIADNAISFEKNCLQCEPLSAIDINDEIKIYPNPVYDFMTIELPDEQNAMFSVYDVQGRTIMNVPAVRNTDLTVLDKGFYFYRIITNENTSKTGQFIKN